MDGAASNVEAAFAEIEAQIAEMMKSTIAFQRSVRTALAAAKAGDVRAFIKAIENAKTSLGLLGPHLDSVTKLSRRDFSEDIRKGTYLDEIVAAANKLGLPGVRAVHGKIMSFPILLEPRPDKLGVALGNRISSDIRPSSIAAALAKLRTTRASPGERESIKLIDAIEQAFLLATRTQYQRGVPISDIYKRLTPLPGQRLSYTELDFVIDLYLLERHGLLKSTSGHRLSFPASTSTTGRKGVIRLATEQGEEKIYSSIRFD